MHQVHRYLEMKVATTAVLTLCSSASRTNKFIENHCWNDANRLLGLLLNETKRKKKLRNVASKKRALFLYILFVLSFVWQKPERVRPVSGLALMSAAGPHSDSRQTKCNVVNSWLARSPDGIECTFAHCTFSIYQQFKKNDSVCNWKAIGGATDAKRIIQHFHLFEALVACKHLFFFLDLFISVWLGPGLAMDDGFGGGFEK